MKYEKNNTITNVNSTNTSIHTTKNNIDNSNNKTNNNSNNINTNNTNTDTNNNGNKPTSNNLNNSYGISTGTAATSATLAALKCVINNINNNISNNTNNNDNNDNNRYSRNNRNNGNENDDNNYVEVISPFNKLNIEINNINLINKNTATASVIKYPYGDIDVTVNSEILATVTVNKSNSNTNSIIIKGGKGIGTVTKKGLQVPVGEAAINPVPKSMIIDNINNYLENQEINGFEIIVELSVPNGEEIAKKTMNHKLGIIGGISILGTSGIAKPMSKKAYRESLACQIDIAIGQGYNEFVFVPGNIGEKIALSHFDINEDQVIKMSNFIGYMLKSAKDKGIQKIVLLGHIGKLIKLAGGIYNTHSSLADCRCEIMSSHAALCGVSQNTIEKLFKSPTTEDMLNIIKANEDIGKFNCIIESLAKKIKANCENKFEIEVDLYITDMKGTLLNKTLLNKTLLNK
ncbi:MAG: cobalt-precorrin-5B (C(1))-methyltransferase CbiD [Methanobacteriaceae archaeon]